MADFELMSIEELESFRASKQSEMGAAKVEFKAAGAELAKKRESSPKAQALRKISEAREDLARLERESEE